MNNLDKVINDLRSMRKNAHVINGLYNLQKTYEKRISLLEKLERGERVLETIKFSSYLEILKRSMNNTEISIGNTSFRNITREKGVIYYTTLDYCNYNFIEINAVDFIRRCKKKKIKIDYASLIRDFVNYNDLSKSSENLILALVSYPYEYMKWVNYYRLKKKELSEEEYKNKLNLSKIIDGDSIV